MAASPTPEAATGLVCPECDKTFTRPQGLAAHRRQAHGVIGSSAAAARRRAGTTGRRRGCPASTRASAATVVHSPTDREPKAHANTEGPCRNHRKAPPDQQTSPRSDERRANHQPRRAARAHLPQRHPCTRTRDPGSVRLARRSSAPRPGTLTVYAHLFDEAANIDRVREFVSGLFASLTSRGDVPLRETVTAITAPPQG